MIAVSGVYTVDRSTDYWAILEVKRVLISDMTFHNTNRLCPLLRLLPPPPLRNFVCVRRLRSKRVL